MTGARRFAKRIAALGLWLLLVPHPEIPERPAPASGMSRAGLPGAMDGSVLPQALAADSQGQAPAGCIFVVSGPNDGEPINSRTIPLRVQTNFAKYGSISVHVDGRYCYSRSLQSGTWTTVAAETGSKDGAYGRDATLREQALQLDLDLVERLRGGPVGDREAKLRVTLYLYDASTRRLVTYDHWQGQLRRPRVELLATAMQGQAAEGTNPLAGLVTPPLKVPVIAYVLPEDTYLFVFSSTDPAALNASPEDPTLFGKARILAAGSTAQLVGGLGVNRSVVFVDRVQTRDRPLYVALWTYDEAGGWKRSPILAIR